MKFFFSNRIRLGYQLLIQFYILINNLNLVNKDFNTDNIIKLLSLNNFYSKHTMFICF